MGIYVAFTLAWALGAIHPFVVMLVWVAFIVICLFTERGNRPPWMRIALFALYWLAMVWPPVLLERLGIPAGDVGYIATEVLVLLFAMRRSHMFVTASP